MIDIDLKLFHEESFVDYCVIDSFIDLSNKEIKIILNGGEIDRKKDYYLRKAEIIIKKWKKLVVIERRDEAIEIPISFDKISNGIIEYHYSNTQLKLVGVGDHCWVDWIFDKPEVCIRGEIDT